MSGPARVRFTEEMKGAVGFGAATFSEGYLQGRASACPLMFHLTISIDDMDAFRKDPDHGAPAIGWVECQPLADRPMPVELGVFNLFAPGFAPGRTTMRYRLWFRDGAGNPMTMLGYKDVGDDPGLDVWKDTTSLATTLLNGHLTAGPRGPDGSPEPVDPTLVRARGIIFIRPLDFAKQLTTFRGTARGIAGLGGMFASSLWRVYRGRGSGSGSGES